jgi:hypothetical protein
MVNAFSFKQQGFFYVPIPFVTWAIHLQWKYFKYQVITAYLNMIHMQVWCDHEMSAGTYHGISGTRIYCFLVMTPMLQLLYYSSQYLGMRNMDCKTWSCYHWVQRQLSQIHVYWKGLVFKFLFYSNKCWINFDSWLWWLWNCLSKL